MLQRVFLVCGVPGSGKSWVCEQLKQEYEYVRHDDFIGREPNAFVSSIFNAARSSQKPILADCPFKERQVREELLDRDLRVIPVFIIESPEVVKNRYEAREKKPVSQATLTRAISIRLRATEWNALSGTSGEIFNILKSFDHG